MNAIKSVGMVAAATLVIPAALFAPPSFARDVSETRPAAADVRIEFRAVTGDIEIIGHDAEELRISGTLGDEVEELVIDGDRNHWKVELKTHDDHSGAGIGGDSTELTLHVPSASRLQAHTVSADLVLEGLDGESVDLQTVSGDLELTAVRPARLRGKTVSGDIDADAGGRQENEFETVSGDLELNGVAGRTRLKSVSGDLSIEAVEATEFSVETVSGDTNARIHPAGRARIEGSSHSGDLVFHLPDGTGVRIRAETFSGSIESEFGGDIRSGRGPGERLSLDTGSAEVEIEARTFSGNLQFHRLD